MYTGTKKRSFSYQLQRFLKRCVDIFCSAVGLILLSPVLLLLAPAVRMMLGSPVLFRQKRPGLGGRAFTIIKFRTMAETKHYQGQPLTDSQRLSRFGRFLRETSLDELPELINVLKGEMSIVGPRPLMMKYLDRYTPEQARRNEVKPGITGWAQINGRNAVSWEDKFKLDVWYVDNWSLWLDAGIIFKTVWMVVTKQGVTQAGRATVDEFMGTQQSDSQTNKPV